MHGESMLQLLMENVSSNEQENRRRTPTSQYSMQALNKGASQGLKPAASNGTHGVVNGGCGPGNANAVLHGVVTSAVRPGYSMSSNTHGTNTRQKLIDGAHRTVEPRTRGRTPRGNNSALPRNRPATLQVPNAFAVEECAGVCSTGVGPQSFEHASFSVATARCGRPSWFVSISYEPTTIVQFWVDGAQPSQRARS